MKKTTFTNASSMHLAKSHIAKITKQAENTAQKYSSAYAQVVPLNKSLQATFDLNVTNQEIQITVKSVTDLVPQTKA